MFSCEFPCLLHENVGPHHRTLHILNAGLKHKTAILYNCFISLPLSYTMRMKSFGILTRVDVIEVIDFLLNFEEKEILQDFLLLLLILHPKTLQVIILHSQQRTA